MLRTLLSVRRVLAALVVLLFLSLIGVTVYDLSGSDQSTGVTAFLDMAILGGILFLLWIAYRLLRLVFRPNAQVIAPKAPPNAGEAPSSPPP